MDFMLAMIISIHFRVCVCVCVREREREREMATFGRIQSRIWTCTWLLPEGFKAGSEHAHSTL